jgi:hypothetical protein
MSDADKQGTVTRGKAVAIGQKAAIYAGLSLMFAFTLSSGAEGSDVTARPRAAVGFTK